MPATLTYPGVYIEEISSGVHTITGVATSITAFIGRASRGPTDEDEESPVIINSFGDYERIFGGLSVDSSLGFAVRDFYLNGGSQAAIVRLVGTKKEDGTQMTTEEDKLSRYRAMTVDGLTLRSANPGKWATGLRVTLDADVSPEAARALGFIKKLDDGTFVGDPSALFNLTVKNTATGARERILNLTLLSKTGGVMDKPTTRRIDQVLKRESDLLRWKGDFPAAPPNTGELKKLAPLLDALNKAQKAYREKAAETSDPDVLKPLIKAKDDAQAAYDEQLTKVSDELSKLDAALLAAKGTGDAAKVVKAEADLAEGVETEAKKIKDGGALDSNSFIGSGKAGEKQGLFAFDRADLFNILCIPPYNENGDVDANVIAQAAAYCEDKRAFYVIDPPATWTDKAKALAGIKDFATNSKNAAIFFPRLRQPNPFHENAVEEFAPCGAIAGIFARTDTERGVWKAPAGLEASLVAVPELSVKLSDGENGELNPKAVNCLRAFPGAGRVVWGSRTLQGADGLASEWKYIPVRRTALFLEESLYRGTQWVVFEPNDEPLWAQIRLNVGAFMQDLFRKGAFQGKTPREAYLVKCDNETTTQNDINLGIVNIIVGFAPLKPAEFVIIKLQQLAGQIEV